MTTNVDTSKEKDEIVSEAVKSGTITLSDEDIAAAIKVLNAVHDDTELYKKPQMREIRKLVHAVVTKTSKNFFGGKDKQSYNKKKRVKKEKEARMNQRRMHDLKLIETRKLRLTRRQQLNSLMENGESNLPMIPDGAADDGVNTAIGQSGGAVDVPQVLRDPNCKNQLSDKAGEEEPELLKPQSCYACKSRFYKLHHFYAMFCPTCADKNWSKRMQKADLNGKVAIVTGGRVKIGYQIVMKLLRMGASVIVTTRFPADAALRLAKENDFEEWRARVKLYGLDFRDIKAVERFTDYVRNSFDRLDIIINNACQTIRRPPAYYRHLLDNEASFAEYNKSNLRELVIADKVKEDKGDSNEQALANSSAILSQSIVIEGDESNDPKLFPVGKYDVNAQQIDLRDKNSWLLKLAEVPTAELVEVLAINSVAPFIINSRLKPLLVKAREIDISSKKPDHGRYIVNVSAMEGKFYRHKNANHPHTNMAKAALNMMTRTSASDYSKDGIYMNAVDTGWINDENPLVHAARIAEENNFQTPIDEVDAAARVLDPVVVGVSADKVSDRIFGKFLKDYVETEW